MSTKDDKLNLDELSLEPIEPEGTSPSQGPAKFKVDTRSGSDRRKSGERRQTVRFEADRRQGDRRAKGSDPWDQSTDL